MSKVESTERPSSADKRSIDKVLKVKHESIEVPVEKKRLKVEDSIPKSRSLTSSPDPNSRPIVVVKSEPVDSFDLSKGTKTSVVNVKVEDDSEATDIEEGTEGETSKDESDFNLDDGLGDISCVVCRDFNSSYNNQLVECQECHQLYHQECHKPPATKEEISDPRSIWYCSKCTKSMKKTAGKSKCSTFSNKPPSTTASSAFEKAINMGKESALLLVKEKMKMTERREVPMSPSPFKRSSSESKPSTSSPTVSKPIGLAGLAANLNKPSSSTLSASSSNAASSTSPLSKSRKIVKVEPVKKKK